MVSNGLLPKGLLASPSASQAPSHGSRAAESPEGGRLRFREKLFYGFGEGGESVKNTALQTFLLFYYVQVLGMPGSLCGLALFLALLLDGATDPIVGSWSDRIRSRLGRRHPFLYAAPVPLALSVLLLFSPPHGISHIWQFAWLLTFNFTSRVAMTLYYVPHMALGAELSEDYDERLSLSAHRMLFTQVGRIVCLVAAFTIFFVPTARFANGQLNPDAYPRFAAFCGIAVIFFVLFSALGTQRRMIALAKQRPPPPPDPAAGVDNLGVRFFRAMGIANFRRCFLALLIMYLFAGTQNVLVVHMNTYFWGFTPQQGQFTFYAQITGFIVGLPLARPLAAKFDKKWAYCFCVGSSCVMMTLPIALRLAGLFPPNGDILVLVGVALANLSYGILGASSGVFSAAMLADIADQYELAHGQRAEGLFFGAVSFSSKASNGMGGALAGLTLDVIHFPRPPLGGVPSALVVEKLGIAYGPILLLLLFAGLSIMFGYDLTRGKHARIVEQLAERRLQRRTDTPETLPPEAVFGPAETAG